MENLLDNASKVNQRVLAEQIAEMEQYRIPSYVAMLLHNLYYYVVKCIELFKKNSATKSVQIGKENFDSQLIAKCQEVYGNVFYMNALYENISYHMWATIFLPISQKAGNDKVSARVTSVASHIFSKKELIGKSVYEINDAIYMHYADKKKLGYRTYLRVWLAIAVLILVMSITVLVTTDYSWKYILPTMVVLELADYVIISRVLGIWHMAKLVWLIIAETGGIDTDRRIYPISSLPEDELHLIDIRMHTLHTLLQSETVVVSEIKKLESGIEIYQKQIEKNNEIISELRGNLTSDNNRILTGKLEENARITKDIQGNKQKSEAKKKELENISSLIKIIRNWLIARFHEKWNSSYKRLQVTDDAIDSAVCLFSIEDVAIMEKRFYEIEHTFDPFAIAKKKSGIYSLDWLTVQGSLAEILFTEDVEKNTICVKRIQCEQHLKETFVTNDELKEALSGLSAIQVDASEYTEKINALQKWYISESKKWDAEKHQLEDINNKLTVEKKHLLEKIDAKQGEINLLSRNVSDKTEECKNLQVKVDLLLSEGNSTQAKILQQQLVASQEQLEQLKKEYKVKITEMEGLYSKIHDLTEIKQKLEQKLIQKEKELTKTQENVIKYNAIIQARESEISSLTSNLQNAENQIVTLNGLLKKANTAVGADKATIEKLTKSKDNLEEQKRKLKDDIAKKKTEILSLKKSQVNAQKVIDYQQKDIAVLREQIGKDMSRILYNEEIYEELYNWILAAQDYIYIVAPFISPKQFNNMKRKLKDATRSNPDLKIKILYGIQDKDSTGRIINSDAIMKARKFMPELEAELGKALGVKETNTHVKVVIVDDKKYMLGSANVMSFSGDYNNNKDLRSEVVICSQNKDQVTELKQKYFSW